MPWNGCIIGALVAISLQASDVAYEAAILKWRQDREARLKADDGWLTVSGLFWLKQGENSAGSGPGNEIALPRESAPARVGSFILRNGEIVFSAEPRVEVTSNGRPVKMIEVRPDTSGSPDVIAVSSLTMHVIQRGKRYGIRLRDKNSRFRREFAGLRWFLVSEVYRVTARFVSYNPPRQISVPNVLGDTEMLPSPGYAVFALGGKEYRLDPVTSGSQLFFIFRDLTSGKETYPAGRFLYAEAPKDGKVILDFNKAYNPPCAFTPHATCPLPPSQNRLAVRITAGELNYHH